MQIKGGPRPPGIVRPKEPAMPHHTLIENIFLSGVVASFAAFIVVVGGVWIVDNLSRAKNRRA